MSITYTLSLLDDPQNPVDTVIPLFPLRDVSNPGESRFEFHVRSLFVDANLDVQLVGKRPVIIRASAAELDDTAYAVDINGTLHADGENAASFTGGKGHCGGGDGGNGAQATVDAGGGIQ